jgi:hypothetical protein
MAFSRLTAAEFWGRRTLEFWYCAKHQQQQRYPFQDQMGLTSQSARITQTRELQLQDTQRADVTVGDIAA